MTSSEFRKRRQVVNKLTTSNYQVLEGVSNSSARNLKMFAGSFYQPKENQHQPSGEDYHFICEEQQTIGVADGVGGCADLSIDTGIYARHLMTNAVRSIQDQWPKGAVDPKQVLHAAFWKTEVEGASTACIITLKDNFLHAANLGDSGFIVIRKGKIVYRSSVQETGFNCPYQLGRLTGYTPQLAKEICVEVRPDDVLVAATDGLFDNVRPDEIENEAMICDREEYPPELMARRLAEVARKKSRLEYSISPFTMAAMTFGLDFRDYRGGKSDDVTVIVGYIY